MKSNEKIDVSNTSITKPASKVMWGGIIGLFVSLASNVIVAAFFGAGADMDAYLTAMIIPTYFNLVFISSLSFVLVPAFIEARTSKEEEDAWALVGTFFWITLIVLMLISILGSVFSSQIINITAPGFYGEKADLASRMLSILMFSTLFTGLGNLTIGIQNARGRFFIPSIAPAFGTLGNVIVLLTMFPHVGSMALCWGFLLSTFIQATITTFPILAHGWDRLLPIKNTKVIELMKLMLPLVLLGMMNSFSPVAERYFASELPDGQLSYMGYVNKISNIFIVLLASGIAASIFPAMAQSHSQDGIKGLAKKNVFGLRLSVAVAIPAVLIATALSVPLVGIFFEYGAFTHVDTIGVSLILFPYFLRDIFFRMVGNVFERSYYVLKDTVTQSVVTAITLVIYLISVRFFVEQWGYVGLVWAATVRRGLAIFIIWLLLFGKFSIRSMLEPIPYYLKYIVAALPAFFGGRLLVLAFKQTPFILQLIAGGSVSVSLYIIFLYFLDSKILISIIELSGIRFILTRLQTKMIPFISKHSR